MTAETCACGMWPITEYGKTCPSCPKECVICGERGADAEMYDAAMLNDPEMSSEAEGGLVHAECGTGHGWEIA